MKLPSFDDLDDVEKSNNEENKKENSSANELPSFDDLLDEFNSDDWSSPSSNSSEELEEVNNKSPSLPSLDMDEEETIDEIHKRAQENFENTESQNMESLGTKDERELEETPEDFEPQDEDEDFRQIDDEDFKQVKEVEEDSIEGEVSDEGSEDENFEGASMGSLLPGMDLEEEVSDPEEEVSESKTKSKSKDKEIDADEKAKEFFIGLKDKIKSLFNKKTKGNPDKPKRKKIDKPKKKLKSENKSPSKLAKKEKPNIKIDKDVLIRVGVIALPVIAIAIFYFMWLNSYSPIEDLNKSVTFEDENYNEELDIKLKDFSMDESKLEVGIVNESDISSNLSTYITFKESSAIPFTGGEINCESDIVNVEPEDEIRIALTCDGELNEDLEYKISVDIDNF